VILSLFFPSGAGDADAPAILFFFSFQGLETLTRLDVLDLHSNAISGRGVLIPVHTLVFVFSFLHAAAPRRARPALQRHLFIE